MATTTFQPYTGNGSNKTFNYSFPTYTASEVVVEVDGVVVDNYTIPGYQTTGTRTVTFDNSTGTLNTNLCESDGAPKNNLEVIVRRDTNIDNAKASYTAGSSLKAADLTNNNTQILRALQEEQNTPTTTPRIRDQAITSAKIKNLTIVDEDISATAEIEVYKLKDGAARQVLQTDAAGTGVQWTSNVDLPGTLDVTGNVDFDSNLNVDGTTTLDGTTVDGALDVNGSATIDNVQVNGNEIDTTSGNLTIDSAGGTTTVDDNLAVTGTLNVTQGITLQNATASLNGSQIVTETASQTLTNKTLTTPVINDLSGTAVVTSGTSTSDNKIYSAKRSDELYYRKGTADDIEESGVPWSGNDSTIATTAAIDARIVDIIDDVGGFVPLVDEGEIPQYHPEKENKDTADRVGTILSIGTLTQTYTPSTGTVTIQASDLSNHSVNATITDCGSTVLPSGFGVLIETKAQTDPQYANGPSFKFHRLVPKATEVTTVASKATEVTTVHTNITNINAVATDIANVNAVAADASDIGAVAAKATEIGRLGTADAVADMAILGTTDVVADLNTLGTADVVADMNMLATSDVVADMNMLAVSDVISDMNDLATSGNITAMANCSNSITSINTASSNLTSINNFGDKYQVAANNPTTDGGGNALAAGDLYFNTSANELKVYNGSSWQGGVTAAGSFAATTGNTFTGDNRYNDGVKALFGTGSDLEIYHNGSHSYLLNSTGQFIVGGDAVLIKSGNNVEVGLKYTANADVELYYDDSKKLETSSTGVDVIGTFDCSGRLTCGELNSGTQIVAGNPTFRLRTTNNSLANKGTIEFYYNTSNLAARIRGKSRNGSNGQMYLDVEASGTMTNIMYVHDSGVDISSGHLDIPNDTYKLRLGTSADLQLYHDGSNSHIENNTGELRIQNDSTVRVMATAFNVVDENNSDTIINAQSDGQVELYYDNTKRLETTSWGAAVTGNIDATGAVDSNELTINGTTVLNSSRSLYNLGKIELADNIELRVGTGNDLKIFHDGSNSFIEDSGTGSLFIESNSRIRLRDNTGNVDFAQFINGGGVELYHNNVKKFDTDAQGINVFGEVGITSGTYGTTHLNYQGGGNNYITQGDSQSTYFRNATGSIRTRIETDGDWTWVDGYKAQFGNSHDLQLYHDGSNSAVYHNGTGNLLLLADSGQIEISKTNNYEKMIVAIPDGNVELYYDASKKLEVVSTGVNIPSGNLSIPDSGGVGYGRLLLGTGGDLQIYHDGSRSVIADSGVGPLRLSCDEFQLMNVAHTETMIYAAQNLGVSLNYDNATKLQTTTHGITVTDTHDSSVQINMVTTAGDSGFLYADSSNNFGLLTSEGEWGILTSPNNKSELRYDNSTKIETNSGGVTITGAVTSTGGGGRFGNINVGASNLTNTIQMATANTPLHLQYNNTGEIRCNEGGGSMQTRTIFPQSNNSYDLGTSASRWRNIYTQDLQLSNEAVGDNGIDGTWGNYTIVEGESDLFLKNNRSGKTYKFNLTEVS